jgi:hypothetical protein
MVAECRQDRAASALLPPADRVLIMNPVPSDNIVTMREDTVTPA